MCESTLVRTKGVGRTPNLCIFQLFLGPSYILTKSEIGTFIAVGRGREEEFTSSYPEHSAQITVCPACEQNREGEARGFVFLDGSFVRLHAREIENLLRNEVVRASEDNPLARILELKKGNVLGGQRCWIFCRRSYANHDSP